MRKATLLSLIHSVCMRTSNQKNYIADDTEFRPFILEVDGKVSHIFRRGEVSELVFYAVNRRGETIRLGWSV